MSSGGGGGRGQSAESITPAEVVQIVGRTGVAGEITQRMRDYQRYVKENVTLVAEEDGVAMAAA